MNELSKLSDEQIMQMLGVERHAPAVGMSDEQLMQSLGKQVPYSGSILPMSKDADGNVSLDSNAGIVGAAKRAFMFPGDALSGKVQMRGDDGNLTDEFIGRATETAGLSTPVSPGSRGAINVARSAPVPSSQELQDAAKAGFNAVRKSGVTYPAEHVANHAKSMSAGLEQEGFVSELAPKTHGIIGKLAAPPAGAVGDINGLIVARRALQKIAGNYNDPTEQAAASIAIDGIDRYIGELGPQGALSGPAALVGRVQDEARANYAAGMRSDRLTGATERAELQAKATNSGQNIDNRLRSLAAGIFSTPGKARGFSDEELEAIKQVAEGTAPRNVARWVGNLLGGGGGLGALTAGTAGGAAGMALGGPVGLAVAAAPPAVGFGARQIANRSTRKAFDLVDEQVRRRSPLYERSSKNPPMTKITKAEREAILRSIILDRSLSGAERAQAIKDLNENEI